ncbi:hypothetical protein CDAR_510101 [Caerostris darwini]|uniref:Uncharacterized protein n=1 Tax=Caerostris darwini TaxID=1538125 RepID=A0AAV4X359_9ARAC|nr:hypothetical protein CDAR_510101 [Caerostris darwini]
MRSLTEDAGSPDCFTSSVVGPRNNAAESSGCRRLRQLKEVGEQGFVGGERRKKITHTCWQLVLPLTIHLSRPHAKLLILLHVSILSARILADKSKRGDKPPNAVTRISSELRYFGDLICLQLACGVSATSKGNVESFFFGVPPSFLPLPPPSSVLRSWQQANCRICGKNVVSLFNGSDIPT